MKEVYEQVEIKVDVFEDTDVITASFTEQHDNVYVDVDIFGNDDALLEGLPTGLSILD